MGTNNKPKTAHVSQNDDYNRCILAENEAASDIARKVAAMFEINTFDVSVCMEDLTKRTIIYLRARAASSSAAGVDYFASSYLARADALEGRAK